MVRFLVVCGTIGACAAAGYFSGAIGEARNSSASLPAGAPSSRGTYGMSGPLRLDVEPVTVLSGGAGDRLRYQIRLTNELAGSASTSVTHYIADPDGNIVRAPVSTEPRSFEGREMANEEVESPDQLDDGFYIVRVLVAIYGKVDPEQDADSGTSLQQTAYFRVRDGDAEPMSADQWVRAPETKRIHLGSQVFVTPLSAYKDVDDFLQNRRADIQRKLNELESER